MNNPTTFPLVTLQPVLDAAGHWVALLQDSEPPLDDAALARLLAMPGFPETLTQLPCVVRADPVGIEPARALDLPRDRLILCFPAATGADPRWRAALAALREAGMRLMVTGIPPAGATLSPGIDSLAVTCPGFGALPSLNDWLDRLPGPHLALGTTSNVCPGFCRFQWLARHYPRMATPGCKGDATTRSQLLKLLALITRDAESAEIEALIRRDAGLAYQLLKLVNSVVMMTRQRIESIAQALVLLGRRQLRRWVMLLLFARPEGSGKPSPLLPQAALRAALLEGLAQRRGFSRDDTELAFMVGMFSLLDRLFGQPLDDILAPLNLADEVSTALLTGEGRFGIMLRAVALDEGPPTPALAATLETLGIAPRAWAAALVEAARWAVLVSREA